MTKTLILGLLAAAALGAGWQIAHSDGDRDDETHAGFWMPEPGVAPVASPRYRDECAGCHMAFPPGLLPARSWRKMMATLDDHFGDNAELDSTTAEEITRYLEANSADASSHRRSRSIMRSLTSGDTPLRITQLPRIRHEHRDIPARLVAGNPEVGRLSNCSACHPRAEQGSFSERETRIAGYGRWDD